jgi:uncharacterized protein
MQAGEMRKLYEYFRGMVGKLFSLKDTPHAIAGGVAIGMFMGFTPLFGLKTLLALGLAWLLRCNPIAAVVSVSLHDVVTPFWPFLLRLEYDIGYWVLSHPHHLPPHVEIHHLRMGEMLKWTTFFTLGLPLLVGSFFLSAPAAVIAYFSTLAIVKARNARGARP